MFLFLYPARRRHHMVMLTIWKGFHSVDSFSPAVRVGCLHLLVNFVLLLVNFLQSFLSPSFALSRNREVQVRSC